MPSLCDKLATQNESLENEEIEDGLLNGSMIRRRKGCKVVTNCEHTDEKHYAKGMCYLCYHKKGRTKLAYHCQHKTEVHYSKGLCQACYIAQYAEVRKKRRLDRKFKKFEQIKALKYKHNSGSKAGSSDT